ncbi:Asunder -like protein [Brachionus plicatilis]|uniref:Asunder-like protein n=1 Tax=Brachionus plicatilis TaxID=10195 RepID=A0A3M7PNK3_BRAPC|nr:Asunder -like protein [Brachionus plicatilis]
MVNTSINHKTIFLFDHSGYFATNCGQTFEFDISSKSKSSNQAQNQNKINPLNKSLWTCTIEAALEFARIVYDLFPEDKLIRLMTTKHENTLNTWNESEQGLETLLNLMGTVQPPFPAPAQLSQSEELILCRALNASLNAIAQCTQLQQNLIKNKVPVKNRGRIVFFTSSHLRKLEPIQEFLAKAIEELNKIINQAAKNDIAIQKIDKIELVIIDMVPIDQNLTLSKEKIIQNSPELRTHLLSSKSGSNLSLKLIQLAQKFYNLAVTSVTNIPMKEELNANSSANYDVDILHHKSLHDQLKISGLLKNCLVSKDGVNTVCLKWSNPKTNITEFNLTTNSSRITPIDVNSRPSSCLTSFLLSGRCVVLEIPRTTTSSRISSHVLCTHGNEIFIHSLNYSLKSVFDDRPSIDLDIEKLKDLRTNEFIDFMKTNTLPRIITFSDKDQFKANKISEKFDKITQYWPIKYSDRIITNLLPLKPFLVRCMSQESFTDAQYTECFKCLEFVQNAESKIEPNNVSNLITPVEDLTVYKRKDLVKTIWTELESFLGPYQDFSDKHKFFYNHIKTMRLNLAKSESSFGRNLDPRKLSRQADKIQLSNFIPREALEFENEKLSKRKKFSKDVNSTDINLYEFWSRTLIDKNKCKPDFYGRLIYPNQAAPLYANLKLDENQTSKSLGVKMDI